HGQFRVLLLVAGELFLPRGLGLETLLTRIPALVDLGGHVEGHVEPLERGARGLDLVSTQRGAVAGLFALLVGRAEADDGLADDQAGTRRIGTRSLDGGGYGSRVMAVSVQHLPAIGGKACRRVIGEPLLNLAVDGDAVVIVEHHQLAEAEATGQRADLVADAFHQAAVAGEYP